MMRPMTCLSLIAALGAGLYLYQEKHTAQMLDRDINRTMKQADQARERIGLLKAEWALLNEPERLQGLAAQHLALQSLQPTQFARLEDLPGRLPAPSATQVNTAPVVDDAPVAAVPPAAPIRAQAPVATAPAARPVVTATPSASVPAPAPPLQLAAARPKPAPHGVAAKPHEAETVAAEPAPRPYYAPVMPAYAPTPVVIHAPTVQTASAVQAPPEPFVGSALGMARTMLAAPVPVTLAAPVPVAPGAVMGYANGR